MNLDHLALSHICDNCPERVKKCIYRLVKYGKGLGLTKKYRNKCVETQTD